MYDVLCQKIYNIIIVCSRISEEKFCEGNYKSTIFYYAKSSFVREAKVKLKIRVQFTIPNRYIDSSNYILGYFSVDNNEKKEANPKSVGPTRQQVYSSS